MTAYDMRCLEEIPDPFPSRVEYDGIADVDVADFPRAPTRRQINKRRVLAAIGAVLYEAVVLAAAGVRADLSSLSSVSLGVGVLAPIFVAGASLHVAVRGASTPPMTVAALLLAPLVTVLIVTRGGFALSGDLLLQDELRCLERIMILFAGPLLLALLACRRAFAGGAPWRTAAVGVGCWGLAAACLELCCTSNAWLHVLLAHAGPIFLAGLIGLGLSALTRP